jgi:adenine-specific DNA-methyltransferase
MAKQKSRRPTPIEAIRHQDTRVNIPTEELRDFVVKDEEKPRTVLYPRDPTLDPQLVWKGKDAQDAEALAVPVVPIYIQEKIHPQALVENLRKTAKAGELEPEQLLFSDFNGLPDDFDRRVDFYGHESSSQPHWSNRMILGDSLTVMTSLAEKEGLKGRVQTIYFDPPYGIKFGSNWQVSTRKRDVKDGKVEDATRQPEQIRAFRDTWQLGVHSYLGYLRDRLTVARDLLTDTGSIFVQIGDENVHLVRCVLDEVFGSENYVAQITYAKTTGATVVLLPGTTDYLLWYAKAKATVKYRQPYIEKSVGGEGSGKYDQVELDDGLRRALAAAERDGNRALPPEARVYRLDNLMSQSMGREKGEGAASWFTVTLGEQQFQPNIRNRWKTNEDGMARLLAARRVQVTSNTLAYVRFIDDFPAFPLDNVWSDVGGIQSRTDPKIYVVQTSATAVQRCLLMTTDPGDLVLDPTCGSGTTAYVAEQWGRRWITIDTSRVALALARTRLMAAKYPYFLLADSPEGQKKEMEASGKIGGAEAPPSIRNRNPGADVRRGFVYKRVPHVTLKSIANNPDIREGMTREEIDAAISRHADTELLYDKPYEDTKRIRVTGPFTVESLSPHRVLATDEERPATETEAQRSPRAVPFETMILDNLRKAGVQNTRKNERLVFERLDPYAGSWVHARGEYVDADKKLKRVAVSIGPEHGTVGPLHIREAAKEAVQGLGHDLLIVCGFAFDPHVTEEAKRYGSLTVLVTRMNPDLAMGDDLLKKTGAGNLFMVFGEPDIEIQPVGAEGMLQVELKGLDIYDPTTGAVRSSSTDDVACWFVDTDYNGESFFVRHAYFTGADEPYEKLKRALRAEIDEAAWSTLYATVSRPFAPPSTGKIAVKVINHYGDEVLKVFAV